jgi:hypothetical protein
MTESQVQGAEQRVQQEEAVMQQYALRWSVLAAWRDALVQRRLPLGDPVETALTRARIKIASGCFSTCEVGCDLSIVEAALVSADASQGDASVDFWLGLLGRSMTGEVDALLKVPAVRFRFADCGVPGCRCASA